jgi:seryl-tRNA synthetase
MKLSQIFSKIRAIPNEFIIAATIALVISVLSSAITYQIAMRKVPKIAVVDLVYLNNDFSLKLARYLADHEVAEEQMTEAVKTYIANLETLLKDINKSGNYILLQKQTVVSEGVPDITKDLEKVLFETVVGQTKFSAEHSQDGAKESLLDRFQDKSRDGFKEESLPNLR